MIRIRKKARRGFTLIELLLVAGILAVLAAFAIPNLIGRAEKAKIKLAQAEIGPSGPFATGLDNYKFDMGKYPASDEGLAVLYMAKERVEDPRYDGPYMKGSIEEKKDPWGSPYEYKCPGDVHEDSYDLWSRGPDGVDDNGRQGSDDIKNWLEK